MKFWTLANLEIVATNAVVGEKPVAPRVIAPVFKDRTSGTFILPPFRLSADEVFDAAEVTEAQFEEMIAREDLSRLQTPFSGKANHDLWIDEQGDVHYQPKHEVKKVFRQIFESSFSKAQTCFGAGEYDEAAKHAFTARAVNPSNIDSLVIRAASERRLQQHQRFALTCSIAERYMSSRAFHELVKAIIGNHSSTETHGSAAISNIATRKSRLPVAA